MTILQRIAREPNALVGVISATIGLAVLFGFALTVEQVAGVMVFVGAIMVLLRQLVVPAAEVVAQMIPGRPGIRAGAAARAKTGTHVKVDAIE